MATIPPPLIDWLSAVAFDPFPSPNRSLIGLVLVLELVLGFFSSLRSHPVHEPGEDRWRDLKRSKSTFFLPKVANSI
jgi:hypothetical protein